jgi:hypothetical protein
MERMSGGSRRTNETPQAANRREMGELMPPLLRLTMMMAVGAFLGFANTPDGRDSGFLGDIGRYLGAIVGVLLGLCVELTLRYTARK